MIPKMCRFANLQKFWTKIHSEPDYEYTSLDIALVHIIWLATSYHSDERITSERIAPEESPQNELPQNELLQTESPRPNYPVRITSDEDPKRIPWRKTTKT